MIRCKKCHQWFVSAAAYDDHLETHKKSKSSKLKILDSGLADNPKSKIVKGPKIKIFNPQELYAKMLKHYIDDKNYPKDRADLIARKITNQQCQNHGINPIF